MKQNTEFSAHIILAHAQKLFFFVLFLATKKGCSRNIVLTSFTEIRSSKLKILKFYDLISTTIKMQNYLNPAIIRLSSLTLW